MAKRIDIKVEIAGRRYPMSIDSDREEIIRKAAKAINDKIASYQARKTVDNPIDYLAMASLQISIENVEREIDGDNTSLLKQLEGVDSTLSVFLGEKK